MPRFLGPREAVRGSPDLARVLALARRPPLDLASPRAEALVELVTGRLRRADRPPGAPCGCRALGREYCLDRLLPAQAWALWEAPLAGGLLAPIGAGDGKTGLDVLAAMVMPLDDRALVALHVPPGLVEQLVGDYHAWAEHFEVPSLVVPGAGGRPERGWYQRRALPGGRRRPVLHVVPYSRYSHESSTDLMARLRPCGVVADEAHAFKRRESVRTGRFLDVFLAAPGTWFCGWSGTLAAGSLLDFTHLAAVGLGAGSPAPLDPDEAESWAGAVDPSDLPAPAGALSALRAPGEALADAVGRRCRETLGWVATASRSGVASSLAVRERRPPSVPEGLAAKIALLRATWERPDGEEFVEALAVARCARELACGFYYKWVFPTGTRPEAVAEWLAARKAWRRELRERLKERRPGMDSPLLCARAAERHRVGYVGDAPVWAAAAWARWRAIRDSVRHDVEAVWVDDYLARDAAAWARASRGIVWYEHDAFGARVAELAGLPRFRGGPGDKERLKAHAATGGSAVVSTAAHATGTDGLQRHYSEQLVANSPPSNNRWEQLLARTHRRDQRADVVVAWVYRHTPEMRDAVDRAFALARFVRGLLCAEQRLLTADCEFALDPAAARLPEEPDGVAVEP